MMHYTCRVRILPQTYRQFNRCVWSHGSASSIEDNHAMVPVSWMEMFTNRYLSFQPSNSANNMAREFICEDEILNHYHSTRSPQLLKLMLISVSNGIPFAMQLRQDMMHLRRRTNQSTLHDDIRSLDEVLIEFLKNSFCRNILTLERITFENSSGAILEKLAKAEAVHRIRALSEMKKRLSEKGRRCFALFHPCLESIPLTFVHVSLSHDITTSMRDIYNNQELSEPKCAIYYSINSPHSALSGLNVAESLLKRTAAELSRLHPSIDTHSTLSPIPGFMKWLSGLGEVPSFTSTSTARHPNQIVDRIRSALQIFMPSELEVSTIPENGLLQKLHSVLSKMDWHLNVPFCEAIKVPMLWMVYYYLLEAKAMKRGVHTLDPLDPVARFHLRNGGTLYQVNWLANTDYAGLKSSAGLMVNYRYDLEHIDDLKQNFLQRGDVAKGARVKSFLECD